MMILSPAFFEAGQLEIISAGCLEMNRPEVYGDCFVQHLGCFFKFVLLLAERALPFVRGLVSGRPVQSVFDVPMHQRDCI